MRRHGRRRLYTPAALLAAAILIVGALTARQLDLRLREVVTDIADTAAQSYCIEAVNECITSALAECDTDFGRLVNITDDGSGVKVLISNTTAINTLKAQLTRAIQRQLTEYEPRAVRVALGTIIGSDLFTDRGPKLEIKIIPLGYVTTGLRNEFTEAGINQTVYRIMLTVNATVSAVLSGYTSTAEVNTEFCISETVIIGAVPDAYTQVQEAQDKISSIYDFMAGESGNGIQ